MADSVSDDQNANTEPHRRPQWWKPGQSGNPGGRPKGRISLVARLEKHLLEHPDEADQIVDAWIAKAKDSQFPHLQEMLNRIDGRVKETVDLNANVAVSWTSLVAEADSCVQKQQQQVVAGDEVAADTSADKSGDAGGATE